MDGQAGFPLIGPTEYPFIGVPWGVKMVGDAAGGTIIRRYSESAFRFFHVQTWLELSHLTLDGGDAGPGVGGAIFGDDSQLQPCPPVGSCRLPIVLRGVTLLNNTASFGGAVGSTFRVHGSGFELTIEDSTFLGNYATQQGGAIRVPLGGSATIRRSTFERNTAAHGAGAVVLQTPDPIEIEDTQFIGNKTDNQSGGAVSALNVRLTRVTMRDNTAQHMGGALFSSEHATIVDSTFVRNIAARGGAVAAVGQILVSGSTFTTNLAEPQDGGAIFLDDRTMASRITNSTFSGNRAYAEGTAISVFQGGLTLVNDTIFGNTTSGSWGPAVRGYWNPTSVWISNSIIAGNSTDGYPFDVGVDGPGLVSLGSNLIGSSAGTGGVFVQPGDQIGSDEFPLDPRLLPLGDNGGPTLTHALAPGSPALDAGSTAAPGSEGACENTDQRGVHRPGAGTAACDIGAFEHVITFPLTVHVGAGGSVVGLGAGGACTGGGECGAFFESGAIVKLEARPGAGSSFAGWLGGGCATTSPVCFVTMDGAQTVTATFHPDSVTTTTTLTSSANPAVNGQDVTFTAVVTSDEPAAGTPTGSVTFVNVTEGAVIGQAPLVSGTATLTRTPRSSANVLNEIKAIYTGDGTFTPSSDTISNRSCLPHTPRST